MRARSGNRPRRWRLAGWTALALAFAVLSGLGVGRWFAGVARDEVIREADTAAALREAVLRSELEKFRSLPVVLAQDPDLRRALVRPDPAGAAELNRKLETLSRETRAAVIYGIDAAGNTIAASNWREPTSFVGANYAFRPYFKQAIAAGESEYFLLGTVSRQPGLFLARQVRQGDGPAAGVVVVKVQFDALEAQWARSADRAFVTGERDVVLITSVPQWRFRTLTPQSTSERAATREILQLDTELPLDPLPLTFVRNAQLTATETGAVDSSEFIVSRLDTAAAGWTLHVLAAASGTVAASRTAGQLTGASLALLFAVAAATVRSRRRRQRSDSQRREIARAELEAQVAARTQDLQLANASLSYEIEERRRTEATLHTLQDDLIQANKLAVLGQVTAGVAHEMNQPLAAIRSYTDNSISLLARNDVGAVRANLLSVVNLSDRIGLITRELRAFARKTSGERKPVRVDKAIDGALLLLRSRLRSSGVQLLRSSSNPRLQVLAEHIRLEQVIVNLLQNAVDALASSADPIVRLDVSARGEMAEIAVADNGPGLAAEIAATLFTPFRTTKANGLGLGLVICRDILADFGGTLEYSPAHGGGARFVILLRCAP
jgi:two-component system C4-dicarboxylate transport sensor histidine kinase DctB